MKTEISKGDLSKCDLSKSSRSTYILNAETIIDNVIEKMNDVKHENISKVNLLIKSQWTAPDSSNMSTNRFHGGGWGNHPTLNSNIKTDDSIKTYNNIKGSGWGNHSASTSNLKPDNLTPAYTNVTKYIYPNNKIMTPHINNHRIIIFNQEMIQGIAICLILRKIMI